MQKAVVFWSGGKDSAMALYRAMNHPELEITGLVTVLNADSGTSSVHQLPEPLIEKQAAEIGIPLLKMLVSSAPSNQEYEAALLQTYRQLQSEGINTVIYGDIFLADIRVYRENLAAKAGIRVLFPLWQTPSPILMDGFIDCGFNAITCCIDSSKLEERFLGRFLNREFIDDLPEEIDPAGENGEFHTFCFQGPIFKQAINFDTGARQSSYRGLSADAQTPGQQFLYLDLCLK